MISILYANTFNA
ncbi:hypothetical protein MICAE_2370017 [Microcystis aeruginosa PCC 9806]|nr:hypothetical protein MICAE_2370017 [Microcystis aeruginosa PCC 9806]